MIRKFNYTGRTKILRTDVGVSLVKDDSGELYFTVALRLDDYTLRPDARVYVEAYHRGYTKRCDYGPVQKFMEPQREKRNLNDCPDLEHLQFRIKVVDESTQHGQIIAAADRLDQRSPEQTEINRISLLHVVLDDGMDERLWRLDFSGEWPELHLNSSVPNFKSIARTDPHFNALVFPAIVREVLREALETCDENSDDADEDWEKLWIRYVRNLPGVRPVPLDEVERKEWVEGAVEAFCRRHQSRHVYERATGESHD